MAQSKTQWAVAVGSSAVLGAPYRNLTSKNPKPKRSNNSTRHLGSRLTTGASRARSYLPKYSASKSKIQTHFAVKKSSAKSQRFKPQSEPPVTLLRQKVAVKSKTSSAPNDQKLSHGHWRLAHDCNLDSQIS